ncbi:MAG: alpha-L-rhamnosidase N-terminal domain-containing protein [Opitutaceae bacterium]|nr:alpha-L-rhamnosidase N-terminal domain-containing protein [Opitutaceae bacterium]
MFIARRSFELPAVPAKAVLFITADTRYQLFTNGQFVARGPARSAAHHQSYDALDLTPFLKAGRNVMAVRFHHAGLAVSYHSAPRPGLLAQLETSEGLVLGTDTRWKLELDPAWDRESPRVNRWHDAFNDRVDLRRQPADWIGIDFNDSRWPAAVSLLPDGFITADGSHQVLPGMQWWPASQPDSVPRAITPPWVKLVPRDIPLLEQATVPAVRLIASGLLATSTEDKIGPLSLDKLEPTRVAPSATDPETIVYPLKLAPTPQRASCLVFDLGRVHNAYPSLELEGPAGTVVDVLTTPYMLKRVLDPTILNSLAADRVILSGRRDRWESWDFKPSRYLAIIVHNTDSPVTLFKAGVNALTYPWPHRGSLSSPQDAWVERLWDAGARTIETITTDAYTDNYRERRQYPQTSYYAARGNYAAFGDTWLQRRYLLQNAQEQEPDGTLGAYAPMTDGQYMPYLDVQFFWLMSWRDYLLFSGDTATTRQLLPAARRVMARLAELADVDGLLVDPPYPYWIDHANIDRRGANFCVNALNVLTLDSVAQTLDWLGEPGAAVLRERAAALRQTLHDRFWNAQSRLFADALVDGRLSSRLSEHANALAVAAHIADANQTAAILPRLLGPDPAVVPATPLFLYWTMAAFCEKSRVDDALAILKARFAHQLTAPGNNGTFWEEWHLDRTWRRGIEERASRADAQGECGIFPQALTRWLAGLDPVAPGQAEFSLRRPPGALKDISAVWPTPRGDLHVDWSSEALTVNVPAGTAVLLDTVSLNASSGSLTVDGTRTNAEAGVLQLSPGLHHLQYTSVTGTSP